MTALALDHVGFMVDDLDAGEALWRRMGFVLSRRSRQMGFDKATGTTRPWATANHIAAFGQGYIELIGVVDPAAPNPWTGHLAKGEGAHILAIRCGEADATYARLGAVQADFDPPLDRRRMAPFGDGEREMRFRNIFGRDAACPEARWILIEHQTPDIIWQEALMTQPNGVVSLDEVIFCAARPSTLTDRVGGVLAASRPERAQSGVLHFAAPGGGSIAVADPVGFSALYEDEPPARSRVEQGYLAAVRLGVADVARSFDFVTAAGFDTRRGERPDSFWIGAAQAGGCVFEFVQAPRR
ncbi:MAG: VOC family protein [Alphaproteobacteria bacterium]